MKGLTTLQLSAEEQQLVVALKAARARIADGDMSALLELEELARGGDSAAMIVLGEEYALSQFVDLAKAEFWFRSAWQANPTNLSAYKLGQFLRWQNKDSEASELFAEGAAQSIGYCMLRLALTYRRDRPNTLHHKQEIRRLLEAASAQKLTRATRLLGHLLVRGEYGLASIPRGVMLLFVTGKQVLSIALKDPHDFRLRW